MTSRTRPKASRPSAVASTVLTRPSSLLRRRAHQPRVLQLAQQTGDDGRIEVQPFGQLAGRGAARLHCPFEYPQRVGRK